MLLNFVARWRSCNLLTARSIWSVSKQSWPKKDTNSSRLKKGETNWLTKDLSTSRIVVNTPNQFTGAVRMAGQ